MKKHSNIQIIVFTKKMNSDRNLVTFKKDIIEATFGLKGEPDEYIAGALCIKHKNHVHIVISGYKNIFGHLNPNYFLHNEIFKYYKNILKHQKNTIHCSMELNHKLLLSSFQTFLQFFRA